MKRRKDYRRTQGHRQNFTEVLIEAINSQFVYQIWHIRKQVEVLVTEETLTPNFQGLRDLEEKLELIQSGKIKKEDVLKEAEEKLKEILDIPVFHDDQHGTAIITSAALINALDISKKNIATFSCVSLSSAL